MTRLFKTHAASVTCAEKALSYDELPVLLVLSGADYTPTKYRLSIPCFSNILWFWKSNRRP